MDKDTRHRKYQLTINNPGETWTHEKIRAALEKLNLKYWCMADEVGQQEQTPHTNAIKISKKRTPTVFHKGIVGGSFL